MQLLSVYNVNEDTNLVAFPSTSTLFGSKLRRSEKTRLHEAVKAIALCHNVTPAFESSSDL